VFTSVDRFVGRKHDGYLRDLSRRNWWRRVWTIQEAAMAPGPGYLLVTSGAEEMPLEYIALGLYRCAMTSSADEKYDFNNLIWTHALSAHYVPRLALRNPKGQLDIRDFILSSRAKEPGLWSLRYAATARAQASSTKLP